MILWFSGTGNSRYVAEKLSEKIGEPLVEMTPDILTSPLYIGAEAGRIIWVFPVYSWGIPPYVDKIIGNIVIKNLSDATLHHLVVTCGDDTGLTAESWRKALKKRGWKAMSAYSVQMPNNYVCMKGFDVDSPEVENDKLDNAPARINDIADGITESEEKDIAVTDMVKGSFAWIKSKIIYPWFIRYAMSPKPFHHTSACISCGKCAAICPLTNITMVPEKMSQDKSLRQKPSWGENCAGCLACYHVCPKHAVEYGNKTAGKGQYMNPLLDVNKN